MDNEAAQVGSQYHNAMLARCARGEHDPETKYEMCGIITAILCFPCGLWCLFSRSQKRCARCGEPLPKDWKLQEREEKAPLPQN